MQVFSASHILPVAVPEQLYCGVIDGKLTVGVADNSPLFEEATEKGGYKYENFIVWRKELGMPLRATN